MVYTAGLLELGRMPWTLLPLVTKGQKEGVEAPRWSWAEERAAPRIHCATEKRAGDSDHSLS